MMTSYTGPRKYMMYVVGWCLLKTKTRLLNEAVRLVCSRDRLFLLTVDVSLRNPVFDNVRDRLMHRCSQGVQGAVGAGAPPGEKRTFLA